MSFFDCLGFSAGNCFIGNGSLSKVVGGCGLTVGVANVDSIVRLFIMLFDFNDDAFVINIELGLNSTSSISSLVTIRLFFLNLGAKSLLDSEMLIIQISSTVLCDKHLSSTKYLIWCQNDSTNPFTISEIEKKTKKNRKNKKKK